MKKNTSDLDKSLLNDLRDGRISKIAQSYYAEKSSELFSEWKTLSNCRENPRKNNNTAFITDGVIDPEKWFSSLERPLFFMKEAHGGISDWDLANDHVLTDGKTTKTWKRLSLWAKGMVESPIGYDPEDPETERFGNPYLHRIAAINVKKYNGSSSSDSDEICEYAKSEKDLIKRQIELCDPTVIVCCGTAKALSLVLDFGYETQRNAGKYYHTEINGHDLLVIDFYHPANRYPEILNYYALTEIYKRALWDQYNRLSEKRTVETAENRRPRESVIARTIRKTGCLKQPVFVFPALSDYFAETPCIFAQNMR